MMAYRCTALLSALLLTSAVSAQVAATDQLLMVFEVIRHGARCGLHIDYFNETNSNWRPGELTKNGKRQQFLLGEDIRQRYIVSNKLLDESYNSAQVYVRATDINRTIESAMAQLLALYPTGHSLR